MSRREGYGRFSFSTRMSKLGAIMESGIALNKKVYEIISRIEGQCSR